MPNLTSIASASRDRLTRSTTLDPAAQLAEARELVPSVTLDELALARLVASEHGRGTPAELACIADAEVNEARVRRLGIAAHLMGSTGSFGPQGGPRPASTRQNPTMRHLAAARAVLRGDAAGISRGARRFFAPKAQDIAHRMWKAGKSTAKHTCSAIGLLTAWSYDLPPCERGGRCCEDGMPKVGNPGKRTEGWVGQIHGVDPWELLLLRPMSRGPDHEAAYAAALAVLRGKSIPGAGPDLVALAFFVALGAARLVGA